MSDRPAESKINHPFEYVVGGSLPLDAVSYVKRSADDEFFAGLKAGKFCYVLNSRQMGKSSLRVRTMARLQADGIVCVSIDMTAIGSAEVTAEQWYLGVLWAIVKQVREQTTGLADWRLPVLRAWWNERDGLSFVQRWGEFIEVLLAEVRDRVVIFVDEIDSVLGLGFRADDFFAAIRECYNRRVDEPQYDRLTFALLGVCAPQDLIQDKRRTPFNIGQAIDLTGFSYEEAIGLAQGLPGGEEMLRSVLDWTGGQPFLTQRVCQLILDWGLGILDSEESIDVIQNLKSKIQNLIESKIINVWESNDEQVHFGTIQNLVMANEAIAGALLGLHRQVLVEGGVGLDSSAEQIALRLTGLVVKRGDRIQISNRIYQHIFNGDWIAKKFLALRPYGQALQQWEATNRDASLLLQGTALQDARSWSKDKQLATIDREFLDLSREAEVQREIQQKDKQIVLEQESKTILQLANRKAGKRVAFGSVFLGLSILGAGAAALFWNIADIRILSLTALDAAAENDVRTTLVKSMKAYQRFRPLGMGAGLNLEPYQVTESEVLKALNTAVNQSEIQYVRNFVDPALKGQQQSHENSVYSVAFSPDGTTIASGSRDNTVKLWRLDGTLITTFKGHEDSLIGVIKVAFSPDGTMIASGSWDKTVKLWRLDGTLLTTLKGHENPVTSVAFSPDGSTIASGSGDKTVTLWRLDGTLLTTLKGHESSVSSVAFSPDGNTIATGSGDKTVKLWRLDGTLITTFKGHEDSVNSVVFSPDGNTIATGSDNKTVKLWRLDGTLITSLKGHESPVYSVSFSPDGNTITSGSGDRTVKLWRRDGTLITTLKGHEGSEGSVNSVAFSPDGNTIASGSGDKTVKLWRRDGTLLTTLKGHERSVNSVAFSPDGNTIASREDKTVKLWRRDGTLITTLESSEGSVNGVVFSPDGNTIASSEGKVVKLWRRDGTLITTLKGHESYVKEVSFSPDGNTIASGSGDNTAKLWRRDGTLITTLKGHEGFVLSVAFSPDGNTIASGSWDKTVKLWRRDGTLITTLKGHEGFVLSVAFSPDGNTIASGSWDKTVKLWRRDGTLITTLKGHEGIVISLVFSPDGNTIAFGDDRMVKLWRRDGTLLTTLKGHEGIVTSVAFSPDGNTITSGSKDNTVKLWRRDGTLLTTLKGHKDSVNSVAFSPDGNTITSGSEDKTVKLWPIKLLDFFAMGCYWLNAPIRDPEAQGLKEDCANVQSAIPALLLIQSRTTAEMGNYTAAKTLLEEAKQRDPKLSIDQPLISIRQTAAQALLWQAADRVKLERRNTIVANPADLTNNFDFLTQAYLEEANFLVRRAKDINSELNLEQELKQVRDKWKASVEELRSKK